MIVLDLDDTLYPERSYQESGFAAVARLVAGHDNEDLLSEMQSMNHAGQDALGLAALKGKWDKSELVRVYRQHYPAICLYPDAAEFLFRARRVPMELVLLTDGRSVTQRNKIRALGIAEDFVRVVISEEVGACKPDDRVYRAAIQGRESSQCVYVADNPAKDFVTPNRHGWMTIMLKDRGTNVHPQDVIVEPEYQAQVAVDSFRQIVIA